MVYMRERLTKPLLVGALVLSTSFSMPFIAKSALAEGLNHNLASSERQSNKPRYDLVISPKNCGSTADGTICRIGSPISIQVLDPSGRIITHLQKVSVTDPEGKSQSILVPAYPVEFIPTKLGQYVFEFEDQKSVVFVSPKEEKGNLKLNSNPCKAGETIWVDVVDAKGNQVRGETVDIISPDDSKSEVIISNELNGFVPEKAGHYKFVYGTQEQVICVKPSGTDRIPTITTDEISKLAGEGFYFSDTNSEIYLKDVGVSAHHYDCLILREQCNDFIPKRFRDVLSPRSYDDLVEKLKRIGDGVLGGNILLIYHNFSITLIDLTGIFSNAFSSGISVHGAHRQLIAKTSEDSKIINFRLITATRDKDKKPLDGGLVVDIEFNLVSNTGSIKGYYVIHDTSICPLSTPPKNPVQ